jgi:hypothetical protein
MNKNHHRRIFLLLLTTLSCACAPLIRPEIMPAGYTYHHNDSKAPIGRDADDIGYDYTASKNDQQLKNWYEIAADLVQAFEQENGVLSGQRVSLNTNVSGAFGASFDDALRQVFRQKNVILTLQPRDTDRRLVADSVWAQDSHHVSRSLTRNDDHSSTQNVTPETPVDFSFSLRDQSSGRITTLQRKISGYGYERDIDTVNVPRHAPVPR